MKTQTLNPELLHKMDGYWRAANYLSVDQIYLYDNRLFKKAHTLQHSTPRLRGHWFRTPGQNLLYVHLRRSVAQAERGLDAAASAGVEAGRAGRFGCVIGVDRSGHGQALRDAGANVVVSDLAQIEVAVETPFAWSLVFEDFDPAPEGIREALCTLGNGYFATRGAAAGAGGNGRSGAARLDGHRGQRRCSATQSGIAAGDGAARHAHSLPRAFTRSAANARLAHGLRA